MLDDNELLFDELYEKTKDCGRVQFINLLMEKERENQELKEQLDYLRSGEYLNQLRFERDMLQHVVDTNGVPSEVYDYLDCTHRNTELLEESQELKEQLDELQAVYNNMFKCHCNRVQVETLLSQQKEFIEYLEDRIKFWEDKIFENSLTEDNFTLALWRSRLITYEEVLNKIEKR